MRILDVIDRFAPPQAQVVIRLEEKAIGWLTPAPGAQWTSAPVAAEALVAALASPNAMLVIAHEHAGELDAALDGAPDGLTVLLLLRNRAACNVQLLALAERVGLRLIECIDIDVATHRVVVVATASHARNERVGNELTLARFALFVQAEQLQQGHVGRNGAANESLPDLIRNVEGLAAAVQRQSDHTSALGNAVHALAHDDDAGLPRLQRDVARLEQALQHLGADSARMHDEINALATGLHFDQNQTREASEDAAAVRVRLVEGLGRVEDRLARIEQRQGTAEGAGTRDAATREMQALRQALRQAADERDRLRKSFSFQFGNACVDAVLKPGANTWRLPARILRAWREARGQTVAPATREIAPAAGAGASPLLVLTRPSLAPPRAQTDPTADYNRDGVIRAVLRGREADAAQVRRGHLGLIAGQVLGDALANSMTIEPYLPGYWDVLLAARAPACVIVDPLSLRNGPWSASGTAGAWGYRKELDALLARLRELRVPLVWWDAFGWGREAAVWLDPRAFDTIITGGDDVEWLRASVGHGRVHHDAGSWDSRRWLNLPTAELTTRIEAVGYSGRVAGLGAAFSRLRELGPTAVLVADTDALDPAVADQRNLLPLVRLLDATQVPARLHLPEAERWETLPAALRPLACAALARGMAVVLRDGSCIDPAPAERRMLLLDLARRYGVPAALQRLHRAGVPLPFRPTAVSLRGGNLSAAVVDTLFKHGFRSVRAGTAEADIELDVSSAIDVDRRVHALGDLLQTWTAGAWASAYLLRDADPAAASDTPPASDRIALTLRPLRDATGVDARLVV